MSKTFDATLKDMAGINPAAFRDTAPFALD
jgi:hypothetical protein